MVGFQVIFFLLLVFSKFPKMSGYTKTMLPKTKIFNGQENSQTMEWVAGGVQPYRLRPLNIIPISYLWMWSLIRKIFDISLALVHELER